MKNVNDLISDIRKWIFDLTDSQENFQDNIPLNDWFASFEKLLSHKIEATPERFVNIVMEYYLFSSEFSRKMEMPNYRVSFLRQIPHYCIDMAYYGIPVMHIILGQDEKETYLYMVRNVSRDKTISIKILPDRAEYITTTVTYENEGGSSTTSIVETYMFKNI